MQSDTLAERSIMRRFHIAITTIALGAIAIVVLNG